MAPGASAADLVASRDMLANVDVTGRLTPTARFMGGREFACLLDGASADAAGPDDLQELITTQIHALPAFAAQGGPFAGRRGVVLRGGLPLTGPLAQALSARQRAALAALYCAQMSAWLIAALWGARGAGQMVIVDGPFAHNRNYLLALAALLPGARCCASVDPVEGTARGAWQLARRGQMGHCGQRAYHAHGARGADGAQPADGADGTHPIHPADSTHPAHGARGADGTQPAYPADSAHAIHPAGNTDGTHPPNGALPALLAPVVPLELPGIAAYHRQWLALIDRAAPAAA